MEFILKINKSHSLHRSSHRSCSVKKGILINFAKFTGKHLCTKFLRTPFLQNTSRQLLLTSFMTPKTKASSFDDLIRLVSCYFASFMALKAKNEKFLWLDKTCFFLFCFVYDFIKPKLEVSMP